MAADAAGEGYPVGHHTNKLRDPSPDPDILRADMAFLLAVLHYDGERVGQLHNS